MKLLTYVVLVFAIAVPALTVAQPLSAGQRSDQILTKARQVDVLSQVMPALFTKEQLKKILPVLEKCRAIVKQTEDKEAKILLTIEASLDKSIKDALEKGILPKQEVKSKIAATLSVLTLVRQSVVSENVASLYAVLEKELNVGQMRAISNAINAKALNPKLDTKSWSQEKKVKFWIKLVLLDPTAYPLLVKLSR